MDDLGSEDSKGMIEVKNLSAHFICFKEEIVKRN
jgi:hypothetical protein